MQNLVLTDQNFGEELKKASLPVLVDFWAPWCGPCRMMEPVLEEIAKDYNGKIILGKVNVDENSNLAVKFGVMSIPTLILFKSGQPVKQLVGYQSKEALIKAIGS